MVRVLYVDMSTLGLHDDHMRGLLETFKDPGTEVKVVHIQDDDIVSATLPSTPYYYRSVFQEINKGAEEGFDAAIIGCCADPGLKPARNMTKMPVFGPFLTGLHMATLLGKRVGVLCPAKDGKRQRPFSWHEDSLLTYGFQPNIVKFRAVDLERPDEAAARRLASEGRLDELSDMVLSSHRKSIEGEGLRQARLAVEDGADVLFFACTLWGGLVDPIAEKLGVPVVDPVYSAIKLAEAAARANKPARGRTPG